VQSAASSDLASAEAYYRQAIELIDAGHPDPERRVEAVIGLGAAQRDQSNPAFRETLLEATHAALALGRTDLAARAAIANFRGVTSVINDVDRERVEALEQTAAAHAGRRTAEVALLSATLAAEVNYDRELPLAHRLELTDFAIEMAREVGDPRVLAEVIIRSARANLVPHRAEAAVDLLGEAVALADTLCDPTLSTLSRIFQQVTYAVVGEHARARQTMAVALEIARTDCPPLLLALCESNWVQYLAYEGRLEEAAKLNDEAFAFAQQIGVADADQWWAAVTMSLAFLQGSFGDLADAAGDFADRYPSGLAWRGTHAWALAEAGRFDEAREVVARYDLVRVDRYPIDDFAIAGWSYPAVLALLLDDAALGAAAEAALRPYEHLWMNLQVYNVGPVTQPIAAAIGAQGRYDEAEVLFARSDDLLAERGIDLQRNLLRYYRALSFSRSPSAAHQERARELIDEGIAAAEAAGLDRLRDKFEALLQ
jgi:hypothetical protein